MLRNTASSYGWVSIILHWLVALTVFGLFGLGWWMVDLSYYDPWYHAAPDWHRSVGILLFIVAALRVLWRWLSPAPSPLASHLPRERRAAAVVKGLLLLLIFITLISGYLISTADGHPVAVFDWFSLPSLTGKVAGMAELAGKVHYYLAWTIMGLAALHVLGALKHHVIDRDVTLRRMLKPHR